MRSRTIIRSRGRCHSSSGPSAVASPRMTRPFNSFSVESSKAIAIPTAVLFHQALRFRKPPVERHVAPGGGDIRVPLQPAGISEFEEDFLAYAVDPASR